MTSLFDLTGRFAIVTGPREGSAAPSQSDWPGRRDRGHLIAQEGGLRRDRQRHQSRVRARGGEADRRQHFLQGGFQRLVDETNSAFGRIDILVCNAASNPYYGPMAASRTNNSARFFENNVLANHWLIQMAAPGMLERNDGSIVIISSIGGLKGSPVIGAYNVSKAADLQLARNLAIEWGKHNVRVNCIAPGLIRTDFARALWENPQTLKAATARTPLGRIGEVDEIAGAAVYLVSKAGSFMTGQTIVIDGGATIAG